MEGGNQNLQTELHLNSAPKVKVSSNGGSFKERNIKGNKHLSSDRVIAFITLFCKRISNEDTLDGPRIQFSAMMGINMNKGRAPKDFERKVRVKPGGRKVFLKFVKWSGKG